MVASTDTSISISIRTHVKTNKVTDADTNGS